MSHKPQNRKDYNYQTPSRHGRNNYSNNRPRESAFQRSMRESEEAAARREREREAQEEKEKARIKQNQQETERREKISEQSTKTKNWDELSHPQPSEKEDGKVKLTPEQLRKCGLPENEDLRLSPGQIRFFERTHEEEKRRTINFDKLPPIEESDSSSEDGTDTDSQSEEASESSEEDSQDYEEIEKEKRRKSFLQQKKSQKENAQLQTKKKSRKEKTAGKQETGARSQKAEVTKNKEIKEKEIDEEPSKEDNKEAKSTDPGNEEGSIENEDNDSPIIIEEVGNTKDDEEQEQEDRKNSTDKSKDEKQKEKEEIQALKTQVLQYMDDQEEVRRSKAAEKALATLSLLRKIQQNIPKKNITKATTKDLEDCVEILTNQIVELELQYQVTKVQLESVMENNQQEPRMNAAAKSSTTREEVVTGTRTKPNRDYAEAVKVAKSTLIIQPRKDTSKEELEEKIIEATTDLHNGVKALRRVNKGLKMICENEDQAKKIEEKIKNNDTVKDEVQVSMATVKKKNIIIFKIPAYVQEEKIKQRLLLDLGLDTQGGSEVITLARQVGSRSGWKNQQVILPEALADRLLKTGSVCLGLRECPIRAYIRVTRCHRCLEYDHLAANCDRTQRCSICAGPHVYTECNSQTSRCHACSSYNAANRGYAVSYKNTNHQANSAECTIYRTLFRIRQLQYERGMAPATGQEVITGRVRLSSIKGVDRVIWLPNHDQTQRNTKTSSWQSGRRR